MDNIKPTADRVFALMIEEKESTEPEKMGAIFVAPQTKQPKQYLYATITAVGPGIRFMDGKVYPPPFNVGEKIFFHAHAPQVIERKKNEETEKEEVFIFLREGDILGTV